MEKVKVKFVKAHKMILEGREVSFREKEIAEIPQEEALDFFRRGIILPGPQHGQVVVHRFEG